MSNNEYLNKLITLWEENGNTREELLIEELDFDVQIETVEHMLKMAGIEWDFSPTDQ